MRVAIVEFWPVHEEVVPSWVYFLNSFGIKPDVYINDRGISEKGNIFDNFKELYFNLRLIPLRSRENWKSLEGYIHDGKYDVIFINSFQTVGSGWASTLPGTKICLVHNVIEFYGNNMIFNLSGARKDIILVTLSECAAKTLEALYKFRGVNKKVKSINASYFQNKSAYIKTKKTNIGIVGGINFNNRDYGKLIHQLNKGFDSENIFFKLIGGGQDSKKLFNLIEENGLGSNFVFSAKDTARSSYVNYFNGIKSCEYLITLFKPQTRYHYSSVSSVINFSLGFSVPLLQDSVTSQIYNVPGFNLDDFNASEIFNNLSKIDHLDYCKLRESVEACNRKKLDNSMESLKSMIFD
ncbi:hypothetical protein VC159_04970 [Polynucleobacter sp. JS-JIR-II-c23]|uniref:hypothetical protein n=1 Tax=Polynucleobacter sp. JS-JIR-II-c23 TaxID=1758393 RepID=UPI002B222D04|nr:hypothetical protein [Polynucleobacter sp. JS-JIR-II-c23]MEA9603803.1 hypothetical protein [Polynucleobacter sp. JS-JIR-II-c23]